MRRRIARGLFVGLAAILAAVLGTTGALVLSTPGRDLLARLLTEESNRIVRGSLTIGSIEGNFLNRLVLRSVVLRDTAGELLADVPRLELDFALPTFLARQFVFSRVEAVGLRLRLEKHRGGRMNYEEILRLGEGTGEGGAPPLLEIRDLTITDGEVEIRTPWNPDGRLRTDARKDSALAAERAKPGRRIEPGTRPGDGLQMVRVIDDLTARFPVLTISTPDRKPLALRIDSLAARISDPAVRIRDLAADVTQGGDSLLFEVGRVALPNTGMEGEGRIDWPRDTVLYDFTLDATTVDLVDLRWISPTFPALTGRGRVTARSIAGSRAEFDLRNLALSDGSSRVDGRMVVIADVDRGLGFRGLDLALTDLDLDLVRPFLDTLPLAGRLTGPLTAAGFFDSMEVAFDWRFADARIEGNPESLIAMTGVIRPSGPGGFAFDTTRVDYADLDLRTVRLVTPAVALDGRLVLAGRLDGLWRNVVFTGDVRHRDGERPASHLTGTARLDTRGDVLALDADLVLDSLAFDGIRGSFPATRIQGGLRGPVKLSGDLNRLHVDAVVEGRAGRFNAVGWATLQPPRWAADSLTVVFQRTDLASLSPGAPSTSLAGRLDLTARVDSGVAPEALVRLRLDPGRIREVRFDSARVALAIHDSLITLDTSRVWWEGGQATAGGTLGWAEPHRGRIEGDATALTLAAFDSLAVAVSGVSREDLAEVGVLAGRARGRFAAEGSLDRWTLSATGRVDSVRWVNYETQGGDLALSVGGGRLDSTRFQIEAALDSAGVGRYRIAEVTAGLDGETDDFRWRGTGNTRGVRISLGGFSRVEDADRLVGVDSLRLRVLDRTWLLDRPVMVRAADAVATIDSVVIATDDGSGRVQLAGNFPGREPGRVTVHALGIELPEIYALLQRDTTGVSGQVAVDFRIEGTRRAPTFRGSGSITGPVLGDFRAPLVRGVFDYADHSLRSNLTFWRTGRSILNVDVQLPLDLALAEVARRQLPGPLAIRGQADSVDLAVFEAFTRNLRRVRGAMDADVRVTGTWETPELGGSVRIRGGGAEIPALGVEYRGTEGTVRLAGDSIVADSVLIRGGDGYLIVTGGIELQGLTRPVLDLTLTMIDFPLIDVRDYLTLRGRGELSLTGPLVRPTLTGQAVANNSVIYFSDLISKDIINLEDPLSADLVDATLLRAQKLGARFQNRFLDSLQIRDLQFRAGEGVWLRSNEANIQLEGRVTVNKERWRARGGEYRVSGQLETPRGTYTVRLGPVIRTFNVDRGTLRYFNTADLDAALDLEASYTVRTATDDIPVIARITGTLLAPKLSLATAAGRASLSERELVSLLVNGTTTNSLFQDLRPEDALLLGGTLLSAELQRALIAVPGAPVDLVEIRPGVAQSGLVAGGTVTSLALGKQIAPRLFAIVNAGFCVGGGAADVFSARYLGASLEYRLHPTLRLTVAAEPVQVCRTLTGSALARGRYQFAADLRWDRDY